MLGRESTLYSTPRQASSSLAGGNATDFHFSKHSYLAFLCTSLQRIVPKCRVQFSTPRRGPGISGRTPLLRAKLPPMLSQCLGSSLLGAKRRCNEQKEREKGMLEYAEDHLVSGNVTELES
ncbi:uncharacterized protein V6R79_005284 [Siganus canaliculatus]